MILTKSGSDTHKFLLDSVWFSYSDGRIDLPVIANMNLSVDPGEFVSLIGPSGCGKTTLLKLCCGLISPDSGKISLSGGPIDNAKRRKSIGLLPQDDSLLPWKSIFENIRLSLKIGPGPGKYGKELEKVNNVVDSVGLSEFSEYYPGQLSGGMRQRVALARSLIHEPELLLLDEPFSHLDEVTKDSMRDLVIRMWGKMKSTTVMVTHSIDDAIAMSDRIVIMTKRPSSIVGEVELDLPRSKRIVDSDVADIRSEVRSMLIEASQ